MSSLRFYNVTTGRFVSKRIVLGLLERRIGYAKTMIGSVTREFTEGRLDLGDWQRLMAEHVKMLHTHSAALGKGGWARMNPSDWGRVGGNIRFHYDKLENFAREIKGGARKLTPGQIQVRAGMYGNSGWAAYWRAHTAAARDAALAQEKRVLDPVAENCEDCVGYAARGWQPLGTLPEPGENSRCLTNCRCSKRYRISEEDGEGI